MATLTQQDAENYEGIDLEELEGLAEIPRTRKMFLVLKRLSENDEKIKKTGIAPMKLYEEAGTTNGRKHANWLVHAGVFTQEHDYAPYKLAEGKTVELFSRFASIYKDE